MTRPREWIINGPRRHIAETEKITVVPNEDSGFAAGFWFVAIMREGK
jgi:hypothetical protein